MYIVLNILRLHIVETLTCTIIFKVMWISGGCRTGGFNVYVGEEWFVTLVTPVCTIVG